MTNQLFDRDQFFRIFLIEDDEFLGADLVKVLEREFVTTSIVWSQTIEDGLLVLKQELKPDVAVSDIRLPRKKADEPIAHDDFADQLRALKIPTIFITGWRETDDVKRFLRKQSLADPTVMVFEKRGTWLRDVQSQIRLLFVRLASDRIRDLVEKFFGSSFSAPSSMSSTAKLIQLSSNYTACWPYLDDSTKKLVDDHFTVQKIDNRIWQLSLKE